MNFTALCFGFNKTIYDYLPTNIPPESERNFAKKNFKRSWRRLKRRFLKHKVKRYAYAKKELCLWGSVKAGIVYYKQCIYKKNRWTRKRTVPWYRVDGRGKIIERY